MRTLYALQGRTIAQQESTPGAVYGPGGRLYLLGDHLGSVSVATDNNGQVLSRQEYTPWGETRSGDVARTTLDFTGQRQDDTGLLYYGARYYDPKVGRFVSADSIVPGSASGKGGAAGTLGPDGTAALRPLTVDFHEPGFASGLALENAFTQAKGFDFQLSGQDRRQAKIGWGPLNPQALNRYCYVLNNPLRYSDRSGHAAEASLTTLQYAVTASPRDILSAVGAFLVGAGIALAAPELATVVLAAGTAAVLWCITDFDCRGALIGLQDAINNGKHSGDNRVSDIAEIIGACYDTGCGQLFRAAGIENVTNHFRFRLALRGSQHGITEEAVFDAAQYGDEAGNYIYGDNFEIVLLNGYVFLTLIIYGDNER